MAGTEKIIKNDGRAFVIALDHPLTMPSPELSNPGSLIDESAEGGADAFLASYGCILRFRDRFRDCGVILRADGGATTLCKPMSSLKLLYDASDALRIKADALLCMGYPGSILNSATLAHVAQTARSAHAAGLAAGAEMLPFGFEKPEGVDTRSVDKLAFACRLGAEMGADFIKTEFSGTEGFREVVSGCFVPVLVLGGSKAKTEEEILSDVRSAISAGASGVIMGRNIFRSNDVKGLCRRISEIVHG